MKPFTVTTKLIKDADLRVFDELKRRLIGERVVKVGFPRGKFEVDGTPVAQVAAIHEFGSPERRIPERSFLRSAIRERQAEIIRLNKVSLVKIIRGQLTSEQALNQLGEMAKGSVQQKIRGGDFAPLRPSTVKRKGSSKPLIDTGQMVQSVSYVVGEDE
mgnify:CR=1 FL=1